MRKQRLSQTLTLLVLLAALAFGVARKKPWRGELPQDPQSVIYAMSAAARSGEVKQYLSNYAGAMEASLRQSLSESGDAAFTQYLRDSSAGIKGIAVNDPQILGSTASVRVEYVYQDRNEAQVFYLEQGANGWKIVRTGGDERVKTLIPYGTPVSRIAK